MRTKHQRPQSANNASTRLRHMTFEQATIAGYKFRWNGDRRCLELSRHHSGWRGLREMADYNRRVEWTQKHFKRYFAHLK